MEEDNNVEVEVKPTQPKSSRSGWKFKVIVLLIIVAIGYGGWKYYETKKVSTLPTTPAAQTQDGQPAPLDKEAQAKLEKETKALLEKVGKLIMLPDEAPTFATILDAKKLIAEEPFYAGSENGDQLLVFPKAQKAIIYNPTKNILVNVGPVYFGDTAETPATTDVTD